MLKKNSVYFALWIVCISWNFGWATAADRPQSDECSTAETQFNRAVDRGQALDHLLGSGSRLQDCYIKGKLDPARLKRVSEAQITSRRQVISDECQRRPDSAVNCFNNRITNPMKVLNLLGVIDKAPGLPPTQIGGARDERYRRSSQNLMICCSFDGHIQAYDLPATNCHGEVNNRSRNWCQRSGPSQGIALTTADTALIGQARDLCRSEPFRNFPDLCDSNGEPISASVRPAASGAGSGAR